MYESFYGLREKPFSLLPDPAYLYLSDKHQMALSLLEYSFLNKAGFCVISGATGAGKTTLIRHLLNQFGANVSVGLITNIHQSFGELLRWILMAFNLNYSGDSQPQLYQIFVNFLIEQYGKNRNTILIIDEAQNMSVETLEELRMLSNINTGKDQVLQIILVGQPGLRDKLCRPELEQFAQRISVDYHLEPLNREEVHHYIYHRLKVAGGDPQIFTKDAADVAYRHSGGTPRLINLLCESALVYGYAEGITRLPAQLVEDVARERQAHGLLPRMDTRTGTGTPAHAILDTVASVERISKRATAMDGGSTRNAGAISSATAMDGGSTRNAGAISSATAMDGGSTGLRSLEANAKAISSAPLSTQTLLQPQPMESRRVAPEIQRHNGVSYQDGGTDVVEATKQENHHHIDIDVDVEQFIPAATQPILAGSARASSVSKLIHLNAASRLTAEGSGQVDPPARSSAVLPASDTAKTSKLDLDKEPGRTATGEKAGAPPMDTAIPASSRATRVFRPEYISPTITKFDMPRADGISKQTGNSSRWIITGLVGLFTVASFAAAVYFSLVYFKSDAGSPASQAPMSVIMPSPAPAPSPSDADTTPSVSPESAAPIDPFMVEALQRERDAAIAQAKALERERDAALVAAQAREQANAAALAAAQAREREKAATLDALKAQERARTAELEAIVARERERAMALEAAAAQVRKSQAEDKAQTEIKADTNEGVSAASAGETGPRPGPHNEVKVAPPPAAAKESSVEFSTNPCKGPSAKFLSTCKE